MIVHSYGHDYDNSDGYGYGYTSQYLKPWLHKGNTMPSYIPCHPIYHAMPYTMPSYIPCHATYHAMLYTMPCTVSLYMATLLYGYMTVLLYG